MSQAPGQQGFLDKLFLNNIAVLLIFIFCCGCIAGPLSIAGLLACQDPQAKSNAKICLIFWGVLIVIGIVMQLAGVGGSMMMQK